MTTIYDYKVKTNRGVEKSMKDYKGKVMLIVNTASKCIFTDQYKELQNLYLDYKDSGLEILGFPCNQFGSGEKGTNKDIENFCQINYGVTFQLFDKVEVNGPNTAPIFDYLKKEAKGLLGSEQIKWNFTKFLVDRNGKVLKRYAPKDKVSSIVKDLNGLI
ncbi:glutathione peroxidase [Neobacillus sp. NPDC093182]|uniref:glutathione peroxidase n=1 Tax=Neobacillus sp. NPDC093182 TaxID=3364297 RepID=UPI0037F6543E